MYISFPRRIRGRKDCFSITVPKHIAEDYDIQCGDRVIVLLEDRAKDPRLRVRFEKTVSKAGTEGRILYIPKRKVKEYGLKLGMVVLVTLEDA